MKIALVGLGNPGTKYLLTPHNVGFMVIDAIVKKYGLLFSSEFDANVAKLLLNKIETVKQEEVKEKVSLVETASSEATLFLIKPKTYMNNSGRAVLQANNFHKFDKIVVVYDDLDLPLGSIRIKSSGSSTHNGVRSIMDCVQEFVRVRIGIGKVKDVLANFGKEDLAKVKKIVEKAVEVAEKIPFVNIDKIMNEYNGSAIC